jgi:hypothetical protein
VKCLKCVRFAICPVSEMCERCEVPGLCDKCVVCEECNVFDM